MSPLLALHGARVVLEVPRSLKKVVERAAGVSCVLESGQPLPSFEYHCPMLSLPLAFKTAVDSIPVDVPYLTPAPEQVECWREKLTVPANWLKVGLAWAGNPKHENDRNRSIALSLLGPLCTVKNVQFYSLQKGKAAKEAANLPAAMSIIDWTDELHDFSDTAALIAHLDLVISVDTAVAHLAAGMGKPVWLLLAFRPDWRWLLDRDDSPWYPTMRLFRQKILGAWPEVIERVVRALAEFRDQRTAK